MTDFERATITIQKLQRYAGAIANAGLTITGTEVYEGRDYITAEMQIGSATLHIICNEMGTARIDKPNRTHKWVYEKSPAQILAVLKQVISFYRF